MQTLAQLGLAAPRTYFVHNHISRKSPTISKRQIREDVVNRLDWTQRVRVRVWVPGAANQKKEKNAYSHPP
jgi:hypothetical protein